MHGIARITLLVVLLLQLAACGGGGGGSSPPPTYSIGGSVAGLLSGASIELSDGQDSVSVTSNSVFSFQTVLVSGIQYHVTVVTQPQGQLCTVSNATGTIGVTNVSNILITCGFAIGGTVSGLAPGGTVVLLDNGADPLTVGANSTFNFASPLVLDTLYTVSVGTQPAGQTCTVNNAQGAAFAGVSNVFVQCTTEVVLWNFGSGVDGAGPSGPLIQGSDGNLYGVTTNGGSNGRGVVFKISQGGQETVLWNFGSGADGSNPTGALIQAPDGNFYGTTAAGGAYQYGTVYRLTPAGVETVIWSFGANSNDGQNPGAGLLRASDGNFYGTTINGGSASYGTVFKITPGGAESVLWNFWVTVGDANQPRAALVQGNDGNLYGTSTGGGVGDWGTIFEITPSGIETVLWSFVPGSDESTSDGIGPEAPLVQGSDGNFYGTTYGNSAVFKYSPSEGRETVLWRFGINLSGGGITDGTAPEAGLIIGQDGNFYGTTDYGGTTLGGTAFKLTPEGVETVLWNFGVGNDGQNVKNSLIQLADGTFYGTTDTGGTNGAGTVFKITP